MTRREVLASSAAWLAALLAGAPWERQRVGRVAVDPALPLLRRLVDVPSAALVGRRYLAEHHLAGDPERLLGDTGLANVPTASRGDLEALRRALLARRHADFLANNTVLVGGWVLARAEAALCGLVALG